MARATTWRRDYQSFVDGVQAAEHQTPSVAVFEGETVARIHLNYQCSAFPSVQLAPWANCLLMGVWLQNDLTDVPALRAAHDQTSEEWMWWENAPWRGEHLGWQPVDGQFIEVDSAPADGGYRDIKAQRRCTADGRLWLATGGEPSAGNQTNHWLNFALSALILLPA